MTSLHTPEVLAARNETVAAPLLRACEDRTFELPPVVHIMMATLFLGFVGVLTATFANAEMVVPFAIFAIFIVAFFTVPALWARMAPDKNSSKAQCWAEFSEGGVATGTGRCSGRDATVLVLLLPVLIFCWAVAVAIIVAFL